MYKNKPCARTQLNDNRSPQKYRYTKIFLLEKEQRKHGINMSRGRTVQWWRVIREKKIWIVFVSLARHCQLNLLRNLTRNWQAEAETELSIPSNWVMLTLVFEHKKRYVAHVTQFTSTKS